VPSEAPQAITEDAAGLDAAIVSFNGVSILFLPFPAL